MKQTLLKLLIILSLILLTWPFDSFAQSQSGAQAARKFDEFGDVQYSDLIARLDNFAIQLQNEPGKRGFIIIYRSHRDLPGLSSRLGTRVKGYLTNARGVSADLVVIVDGGEASCLTYELWIVPVGAAPKPRDDAYSRHFLDMESAWKFDEYSMDDEEYPVGNSLEALAETLRKLPRAQAYILAYSQYHIERKVDSPNTALKMLRAVRDNLVNKYRLAAYRIKVVNGGYRKQRGIEFWIVPRGEHPPIPTPNAFPKKRR
jgi:hypothetical protein